MKKKQIRKKITKQLAVFEKPVCWFYINGSYFSDCLSCISFSTSKRVSVHSSVRLSQTTICLSFILLYTHFFIRFLFFYSPPHFLLFFMIQFQHFFLKLKCCCLLFVFLCSRQNYFVLLLIKMLNYFLTFSIWKISVVFII